MTSEDYERLAEALKDKIEPKALEVLRRVRDACREAGMRADDEPVDMSSDDYRWSLRVWRPGSDADEDCIDISLEIAEAHEYGDDEDHPNGVNFGLDIVEWGGRILGGLTPYNYTEQCWVDMRDADAIDARWSLIEQADPADIPPLCIDN